jgi:hypothetical protein
MSRGPTPGTRPGHIRSEATALWFVVCPPLPRSREPGIQPSDAVLARRGPHGWRRRQSLRNASSAKPHEAAGLPSIPVVDARDLIRRAPSPASAGMVPAKTEENQHEQLSAELRRDAGPKPASPRVTVGMSRGRDTVFELDGNSGMMTLLPIRARSSACTSTTRGARPLKVYTSNRAITPQARAA